MNNPANSALSACSDTSCACRARLCGHALRLLVLLALTTAAWFAGGRENPGVFFSNLLCFGLVLALGAAGTGSVILAGGFDFSAAGVVLLSGIAGGLALNAQMSLPLMCALVAATGLAGGLLNALLVVTLRLNGYIATFATMLIGSAAGAILISRHGDKLFAGTHAINKTEIPGALLMLLIAALLGLAGLFLHYTSAGMRLRMAGANAEAARQCGIDPAPRLFGTYLFSGLCAGLVAVALLLLPHNPVFNLLQTGGFAIPAAALVGGFVLGGGRGGLIGVVLGGLIVYAGLDIVRLCEPQTAQVQPVLGEKTMLTTAVFALIACLLHQRRGA